MHQCNWLEIGCYPVDVQPLFNVDLVRAKENCARQGIAVNIYASKIVHTEDSVSIDTLTAGQVDSMLHYCMQIMLTSNLRKAKHSVTWFFCVAYVRGMILHVLT